jgi:beta-glucanase (GH16 family)
LNKLVVILGLMLFSYSGFTQCEVLVWSDEFDSETLDESSWNYIEGNGCPNLCGWGNGELEVYTDSQENVFIEDGSLILRAIDEGNDNYTSGRLTTEGKVDIFSGRIVARIKMPFGQGLWPAFWMLPSHDRWGEWPLGGEIDIVEMLGQTTNQSHGTIHFGGSWPLNQFSGESTFINNPDLSEDFHEYEVQWNENEIKWLIDGVVFSTKTPVNLGAEPWRFNRPFHILLNVAVGGYWPGYPDASTQFPQQMEIDYVRVYQDPTTMWISGDEVVQINTPISTYQVPEVEGATYTWSCTGCDIAEQNGNVADVMWNDAMGAQLNCFVDIDGCVNELALEVDVLGAECESMVMDREDIAHMNRSAHTGSLFASINPSSNEVNSSPNCYRYVRNPGEVYDAFRFVADFATDGAQFTSGDYVLAMDVFSTGPIGTSITINLENNLTAKNPYPQGRHSVYSTNTALLEEWETVYFNFDFSPDLAMGDDEINQLVILFAPGSTSANTYYLDNVRVVEAGCITTDIQEKGKEVVEVFPNPFTDEIQIKLNSIGRGILVTDVAGRVVYRDEAFKTGTLDASAWEKGVYFITTNSMTDGQVVKVVKQ